MAPAPNVDAMLLLRSPVGARVGAERVDLLAAIAAHGSISGAARACGLSYRGAWDAVQALNNLFDRPLVTAQPGGREGGAAVLTPAGHALIAGYRAIKAELAEAMARLQTRLDDPRLTPLIGSIAMKTSARNALRGVVQEVRPGAVNSEVTLRVSDRVRIVAILARESVDDLGLVAGRDVVALIKSSFVVLAPGEAPPVTSARNCLTGVISRIEPGAVNSEVVLDLDEGKTLTATVTCESVERLALEVGMAASALVKASHVILALA